MAKYAGPDNIEETAGTAAPEGERFSILRMARLLEVSTSATTSTSSAESPRC